MAYGLTVKTQQRFSAQLAEIIGIDAEIISAAIDSITREEVKRVAANKEGNNGGCKV